MLQTLVNKVDNTPLSNKFSSSHFKENKVFHHVQALHNEPYEYIPLPNGQPNRGKIQIGIQQECVHITMLNSTQVAQGIGSKLLYKTYSSSTCTMQLQTSLNTYEYIENYVISSMLLLQQKIFLKVIHTYIIGH